MNKVAQVDLTGNETEGWTPKPVDEWTRHEVNGIEIREKVVTTAAYEMKRLDYILHISKKGFDELASFAGDEEVKRVVANKTKIGKSAKLTIEKKIKADFVEALKNGAPVIDKDEFQASWIDVDKYVWHTGKYEWSCKVDSYQKKLDHWRKLLHWPKPKKREEKAEKARGEIRVWVQHKLKLRPKEFAEKGVFDSHYDAVRQFIHDTLSKGDTALEQFDVAAKRGEEL